MENLIPHRIFTAEGWHAVLKTITNREIAFSVWAILVLIWACYKSPRSFI